MARIRARALITSLLLAALGPALIASCGGPPAALLNSGAQGSGSDAGTAGTGTGGTGTGGAVRSCGMSAGTQVCVSVPTSRLSGDVEVNVTANPAPDELHLSWGPTADATDDLLVDFHKPWTFRWPTTDYPDGPGFLVLRAAPAPGGLGDPVSV